MRRVLAGLPGRPETMRNMEAKMAAEPRRDPMPGHSTVTVTEKYPHLADDFGATEIAKFSLKPPRLRAV